MKKKYMFLLIGLLAVSLILVGCSKSTTSKTSKKALAGKAIFVQDWESCDQTPGCWDKFTLCTEPQNKNCEAITDDNKRTKCEDNCLEYARGYMNNITVCPSSEFALSFAGKHNYRLIGQFQMGCNLGSKSGMVSNKGTTNFNFDCGNDPLTGLQGNYNSDLRMHQILGFCGGNQGVNERPGEPNGKKFWDCGQTEGIVAVDFKVGPKGFINDINKVYCAGDVVPSESPFSWGVMKKVAAPAPVQKAPTCTFKAKQTCLKKNPPEMQVVTTLADCSTTTDIKKGTAASPGCGDVCIQYKNDNAWCGSKNLAPATGNSDELWRWPLSKISVVQGGTQLKSQEMYVALGNNNTSYMDVGWYGFNVTSLEANRAKLNLTGTNLSNLDGSTETPWLYRGMNYTFYFNRVPYKNPNTLDVNITNIVFTGNEKEALLRLVEG